MLHLINPSMAMLSFFLGPAAPLLLHASASHAADAKISQGEKTARASNCLSCHAVDHKRVRPAYRKGANRYAEKGDAVVAMPAQKIRAGGADNRGEVPMTAHSDVGDDDAPSMVTWILSAHGAGAAAVGKIAASGPAHTYKDTFCKSIRIDGRCSPARIKRL